MSLTEKFQNIIYTWRKAFCKEATFKRAQEHALAAIASFGHKTIASFIIFFSRDQEDHSSDYRLYNTYKWDPNDLFDPILLECLKYAQGNILDISVDDTRIKKTGKKIPGASWQIDAMGPPFQVNLIWGMRYLQFSAIIPHKDNRPPRAIPIRFTHAPNVKKPGKNASLEQIQAYKAESKRHNLSQTFLTVLRELRTKLDRLGYGHIKIRISVDGSFCNKNCLRFELPNVEVVARCRKNTVLCFPTNKGTRGIYGKDKFNPESVRQNDQISWSKAECFYGGCFRLMRYKECKDVLWQNGTQKKKMRLLVLAPIPYVKGGIRHYRQPAYILTTDLVTPTDILIQAYLNRWQIEVNFKEEKSVIGVGEAQLWSEKSVTRQPAFCVASYSALLLASILDNEDKQEKALSVLPKWRKVPIRPSCRHLKGQMRRELIENPSQIITLDLSPKSIALILSKAA